MSSAKQDPPKKGIYNGKATGFYLKSSDGAVKVAALTRRGAGDKEQFNQIYNDIQQYKWKEEDFLLAAYPKNGML